MKQFTQGHIEGQRKKSKLESSTFQLRAIRPDVYILRTSPYFGLREFLKSRKKILKKHYVSRWAGPGIVLCVTDDYTRLAASLYFQIISASHFYSQICSQLLREGQKLHDNPKFLAASFHIVPNISHWRLHEAWAEKSIDTEVSDKGEADPGMLGHWLSNTHSIKARGGKKKKNQ